MSPAAISALMAARHALVTTEGLRCTDLTPARFDELLAQGAERSKIEFTLDHTKEIAAIDAILYPAAEVAS